MENVSAVTIRISDFTALEGLRLLQIGTKISSAVKLGLK